MLGPVEDTLMHVAAIEAGGTKFNLAIGRDDGEIVCETRVATRDPADTLAEVEAWFRQQAAQGLACRALGIGSFGPVDLDPASPTWGHITTTPKPGWGMTDLAGRLGRNLGLPVYLDTDVNTAALWEARQGVAAGLDSVVYYTIGTGIGGGAVIGGRLIHGLLHPEMGHMLLKRHPDDRYAGFCPYHGDCAEGLAAGPAVEGRWQTRGEDLAPEHPAWELEAWYIAQLVVNTQLVLSPEAVVLGGGVMQVPGMLDRVRRAAAQLAAGYLAKPASLADWTGLIRLPSVDKPGLQGALVLAGTTFPAAGA